MFSSSLLRRAVAWAMLGLYALVASGLPLPVALPPAGTAAARKLAGKDRSQPFPCMDKACGCDSAERCFTNCCCHTPAETLRWAKARGIEQTVIQVLQRRVAAAAPAAPAGGCCAAKQEVKPSCCTAAVPPKPSCCAADEDDACGDDAICVEERSLVAESAPAPAPADDEPAPKVVTLRAMLACGGIVAQWAAACVSLPPPEPVTCLISWPCVDTVAVFDERACGTGGPPDLPPPRGC
jgi:hypothetical protein